MELYLKEYYEENITKLLNDSKDAFINLNLTNLKINRPKLFRNLTQNFKLTSPQWDRALLEVQKQLAEGNNTFLEAGYQIKENCHVQFVNLPINKRRIKSTFPTNDHTGSFMQVEGSVVRIAQSQLIEYKREYVCNKCKQTFTIEAAYERMYVFDIPRKCPNPLGTCKGMLARKSSTLKSEYCIIYQEIRIQELHSVKNVPASMVVTLENDLVNRCQPGDRVKICGLIERRWRPTIPGRRFEVIICMRANGITKDDGKANSIMDYSEHLICVRSQWENSISRIGLFPARDTIIRSICPEIHGMYMIKLAIALALCSGVSKNRHLSGGFGSICRGHAHLLLTGDPGMAKSILLKGATKISLRSVRTTGFGCSAAGLTAAAIQENGEWHLEAGALVLANGGVCCIDEFNLMRENDKGSIHEAMEQQTISIAKAGIVSKISTQCAIIAAANPRNSTLPLLDVEEINSLNVGIGTPLLSRFDLVLILRDGQDSDLEARVIDHILTFAIGDETTNDDIWNLERLQSHILAIHEVTPRFTQDASTILAAYYEFCRSDPYRDPARTTVRLLDSLTRLAQAHARLTLRDVVEGIDAILVVRLMEFSWGFGRLLKTVNILKENLPLGPNEEQIREVLRLLRLDRLEETIIKQSKMYNDGHQKHMVPIVQSATEKKPVNIDNLEKLFGYHENTKRIRKSDGNKENFTENTHLDNILEIKVGSHQRDCSPTMEEIPNTKTSIESKKETKNNHQYSSQISTPSGIIFGNIDDIDDVDLELDIDIQKMSRQNKEKRIPKMFISNDSNSQENFNTKRKNLENITLDEDTFLDLDFDLDLEIQPKPKIKAKDVKNTTRSHTEIKKKRSDQDTNKPSTSKVISTATLTKLNRFRNADYEVSPVSPDRETHKSQNYDYQIQEVSNRKRVPDNIKSSSLFLAFQNDDLECLDFDI